MRAAGQPSAQVRVVPCRQQCADSPDIHLLDVRLRVGTLACGVRDVGTDCPHRSRALIVGTGEQARFRSSTADAAVPCCWFAGYPRSTEYPFPERRRRNRASVGEDAAADRCHNAPIVLALANMTLSRCQRRQGRPECNRTGVRIRRRPIGPTLCLSLTLRQNCD